MWVTCRIRCECTTVLYWAGKWANVCFHNVVCRRRINCSINFCGLSLRWPRCQRAWKSQAIFCCVVSLRSHDLKASTGRENLNIPAVLTGTVNYTFDVMCSFQIERPHCTSLFVPHATTVLSVLTAMQSIFYPRAARSSCTLRKLIVMIFLCLENKQAWPHRIRPFGPTLALRTITQ